MVQWLFGTISRWCNGKNDPSLWAHTPLPQGPRPGRAAALHLCRHGFRGHQLAGALEHGTACAQKAMAFGVKTLGKPIKASQPNLKQQWLPWSRSRLAVLDKYAHVLSEYNDNELHGEGALSAGYTWGWLELLASFRQPSK